jgi:hypothetical protein
MTGDGWYVIQPIKMLNLKWGSWHWVYHIKQFFTLGMEQKTSGPAAPMNWGHPATSRIFFCKLINAYSGRQFAPRVQTLWKHRPFSSLTLCQCFEAATERQMENLKQNPQIHKSTLQKPGSTNSAKPTFQIPPILNMRVIYEDFVRSSCYIINEGSLELFRPFFLGGYVWAGVFHSAWT